MLEEYKDIISIAELCKILQIGKNSAYRLLKSGEIQSVMIAGKYRILKKSVIEFIESQTN